MRDSSTRPDELGLFRACPGSAWRQSDEPSQAAMHQVSARLIHPVQPIRDRTDVVPDIVLADGVRKEQDARKNQPIRSRLSHQRFEISIIARHDDPVLFHRPDEDRGVVRFGKADIVDVNHIESLRL